MLDFSRELSEAMAAGQAAGMPGTHIIHLANQPADHILMIGIRTRTHGARNMRDRSA